MENIEFVPHEKQKEIIEAFLKSHAVLVHMVKLISTPITYIGEQK